jgi:excisionase family DNA binding protein
MSSATLPLAEDRLYDAEEVAAYLHVSKRTVEDLARGGKLKSVPVGRFRRFRPETVRAWAEEQER